MRNPFEQWLDDQLSFSALELEPAALAPAAAPGVWPGVWIPPPGWVPMTPEQYAASLPDTPMLETRLALGSGGDSTRDDVAPHTGTFLDYVSRDVEEPALAGIPPDQPDDLHP